jgi:hypothetical protein
MRAGRKAAIPSIAKELSEYAKAKRVARLLTRAVRQSNETAEAVCSVLRYFDKSDVDLHDEVFAIIFANVSKLARLSPVGDPSYRQETRTLVSRIRDLLYESRIRKKGFSAHELISCLIPKTRFVN